MTKAKKPTYEELRAELDQVMAELSREDIDVDDALSKYQLGLELVDQVEKYLEAAGNKVTELKSKFNPSKK